MSHGWPAAELIQTARLELEPLRVEHAEEMAPLLDDVRLHGFIGGQPATLAETRARYGRQVAGGSSDGAEGWLNWVVRVRVDSAAAGTVQATLHRAGGQLVADLAWVIAVRRQGNGYAGEAARAMADWLCSRGAQVLVAHVHPDHRASIGVAKRLGLEPTDAIIDGETVWASPRS